MRDAQAAARSGVGGDRREGVLGGHGQRAVSYTHLDVYKRQGQFGDCWLRIEPNPGAGYEFVDEIVGGKIPRGYLPAIDKGVQDAMREGFLAGYPMEDIKCAVYDLSLIHIFSGVPERLSTAGGLLDGCTRCGASPASRPRFAR